MANSSGRGDASAFQRLTNGRGLTYQPGLDGLRGIAVVVIVLFHLGLTGASGGYLAVNLFFTLSGLLIGSVVLHEITSTGHFSWRRFWVRRARRLLPAAPVTLAIVAVARHLTTTLEATSGRDVVAALFDVSNWWFIIDGTSYADLFGAPTAVVHFWSLSIEEQFYLGVGVAAVLVAHWSRRPVRTVGVVAGGLTVVSFALPFVVSWPVDRVYYGTDTRAGELMLGVTLAAVFASPTRRASVLRHTPQIGWAATVAAVALLALWHSATPGTDALRHGLLPLTATISAMVIVGSLMPAGPVAAVTRAGVVRRLGRVSYALYLVHWPVIIIADQVTTDRSVVRHVVVAGIALVLAQGLTMVVERPVRARLVPRPRLLAAAALTVAATGAGSAFAGRSTDSVALLDDLTAAAVVDAPSPPVPVTSAAPGDADLPRVALFGDSVAFSILLGLGDSAVEPDFVRSPSDVRIGCGIALSPFPPTDQPGSCDDPPGRFAEKAASGDVDVALMISCQWELVDQRLSPGGASTRIGEPVFDTTVRARYLQAAAALSDAGVERILWMTCPHLSEHVGVDGLSPLLRDSRDPQRVDRLNEIIADVAATRDDVEVFPFSDWVDERVNDTDLRPDGSHYEYRTSTVAADQFITTLNAALSTGSTP